MSEIVDTASPMLAKMLSGVGGEYTVTITPASNTAAKEASNADKLAFLAEQGRDFLQTGADMDAKVTEDLTETIAALLDENLPVDKAFEQIGPTVRDVIRDRLEHSGASGPPGFSMPELSPEWVAHKGHSAIGKYTGHLIESLADADVETERTG